MHLEIFDAFNDDSLSTDVFVDIEDEICRLILQTHWKSFKNQINEIYWSSKQYVIKLLFYRVNFVLYLYSPEQSADKP